MQVQANLASVADTGRRTMTISTLISTSATTELAKITPPNVRYIYLEPKVPMSKYTVVAHPPTPRDS